MDKRGLERHIAKGSIETRILNTHAIHGGRAATVNTIAAEQGKRNKQIRDGFDALFRVTGRTASGDATTELMPRFKVFLANDKHGLVTVEVSKAVLADGPIEVKFFESGYMRASELYEPMVVTKYADSGRTDFAASVAHSVVGTFELLQETQGMQEHAEDTLALLWGAISDPELNPDFAPRARNEMLAAAEAATEAATPVAAEPVPVQESAPPA